MMNLENLILIALTDLPLSTVLFFTQINHLFAIRDLNWFRKGDSDEL